MTSITWNAGWQSPNLIGFDNFFQRFDQVTKNEGNFPPYNVKKVGDDYFEVELAVAGFSEDELTITEEDGKLTISGEKKETTDEYLYKGIASRKFTRTFALSEYVTTVTANLKNGILFVGLKKDVPDEKKPRTINIGSAKATKNKLSDHSKYKTEKYPYSKSIN